MASYQIRSSDRKRFPEQSASGCPEPPEDRGIVGATRAENQQNQQPTGGLALRVLLIVAMRKFALI